MKRKGFGVEDTPFMILATVAVLMLTVWIGMEVMASFVEGNEYQAAVEASTDIYKRAKLLSLGYDGSSDSLIVSVPEGYQIEMEGPIRALKLEDGNETNTTELTELEISGVEIVSEDVMESGIYDVHLTYSSKDAKVSVSWE